MFAIWTLHLHNTAPFQQPKKINMRTFNHGFWYALTLMGSSLCSGAAHAQTGENQRFDLPEQALQTSLIEFALQADITIVVDNQLLDGLRAQSVTGARTIEDGLRQLLGTAPLSFHYYPEQRQVVVTSGSPASPAAEAIVEELVITGLRYPFRYNTITNTQEQGNIPYYDSSRFLNVIGSNLLADQQAADLNDVLKFTSAITPGDGLTDSNDDIFIRGFQRHAIYVDGFRLGDSTGVKLLPANIERIEILKGPSTLHYGQAEPGGIVNVVRKKPQNNEFANLEIGGGNLGREYANLDLNGQAPFTEDINLRLVMADDGQEDAGEIHDLHKQLVAPSATWNISSNTSLNLGYEYQRSELTWDSDQEIFRPYEDIFPGVNLKDASKHARPDFTTDFNLFNAELSHYFDSDWHLDAKYFWHREERLGIRTSSEAMLHTDTLIDYSELGPDYLLLLPGSEMALPIIMHTATPDQLYSIGKIRSIYDEAATETGNAALINLEGDIQWGNTTHHVMLGGDWHRQDLYKKYTIETRDLFHGQRWSEEEFSEQLADIANIIFDPKQPLGDLKNRDLGLIYDDYGSYFQDNIQLNKRWMASLGARYTITRGDFTDFESDTTSALKTYKRFSTQLGLVYEATDNHSIYLNYSQALRANYQIDELGSQPADPELSDQWELGLKSHLLDGRLVTTVALFDIDKTHVIESQRFNIANTFSSGREQRVRGLDLDLTLQASSKLNVIGALSLLEPSIESGINAGKRPALVAEQTASLFLNYAFTSRLRLSTGASYVGERFGDNAEQFVLPAYTTVDASLAYEAQLFSKPVRLQLSAKNLLDEHYYTAILGGVRINQAEGRTLVASMKVSF